MNAPPSAVRTYSRATLLFALPLIILIGIGELLLYASGETRAVSQVLHEQERNPDAVFMRGALDQGFYRYKYEGMHLATPRILVLGSSRAVKLRHEFFGVSRSDFYNAGGLIQNVDDLEWVSARIPASVDVVIVALDQWWLNGAVANTSAVAEGVTARPWRSWQAHLLGL